MIRRPATAPSSPAPPRIGKAWLVTFADTIALVLTFFVMLYAMQKVDGARFAGIAASLSRSLAPQSMPADVRPRDERNTAVVSPRRAADLGYVETLLAEKLRKNEALAGAVLRRGEGRMVLALPAGLLFEPGGADIAAAARPALADLAGMLGNIGNAIAVEGHSDPTIADDGSTRSDRAISIERAIAVAAALRAAGYPREVKTAGFGSSRFAELAGVEPRERRYALARRVDIVVRPYREAP